jgi:glycosyltransferase involved in cell wall biosynthesis
MRILQVIPFFTPEMGGSAQVAYQISRRLSERGHDVSVVTSDYSTARSRFHPIPFRVVYLPCRFAPWGFYATPGLVSWVRENLARFDVVHLHTVRTFQNAVVHHFARRYKVPYVLSAHGTLPVIAQRKLAKRLYDMLFGRALIAGASRVVAVSPVERAQYQQVGIAIEHVQTIHNGLDLDEFASLPASGRFRRSHGILDDVRIVLFLGRLHKIKGLAYLVEAFAQLVAEDENCILVIAGPDDGELKRLTASVADLGLRERTLFVGPLYGEKKLAAYVDADVLASPGSYEIFGLVPFEALMCGTPVVVTDSNGCGQLLQQAEAGYVVPQGDVAGLACALRQAAVNRRTTTRYIEAGQAFVRERLDWWLVVTEWEDLYTRVVRG